MTRRQMSHHMQNGQYHRRWKVTMRRITRIGLLAGLYLLPLTLYVGVFRNAPSPPDAAAGGLENCGTVLRHQRSPNADPSSVDACERPRRRAELEFLTVAAVNITLPMLGPVAHFARRRAPKR